MKVKHRFVATQGNGADDSLLRPLDWNADQDPVYTVQTKSTNYTVATDADGKITDDIIRCSGTMTLTVPAATGSGRSCLVIMDSDTVAVTINRSGSDAIGPHTSLVATTAGDSLILTDEGTGTWGLSAFSTWELREGCQSTTTSAGTTALTAWSKCTQLATGSAAHTFTLPVVSTFALGQGFQFVNLSTVAIVIQSSGGNTVATLAPGESAVITCVLITGTTEASWNTQPRVAQVRKVLAANFTTNVSTALTGITGLGFAIGNNEKWAFECHMSMGNSGATGCSYGITVSAGAPTIEAQVFGNTTSVTAMAANRITALNTASTSTTFGGAAATTAQAHLTGVVTAGASDACTVYPAIRPRGATTTTTFADSWLLATRLSP